MNQTPAEIRMSCRQGMLTGPTFGLAPGFIQANLVIVPAAGADDFKRFCQNNPKPCPLLEMTEPGSVELQELAKNVDLRMDLPKYRVFKESVVIEQPTDITKWWRDDLVSFLLGCSFSFEQAMVHSGLPLRHVEEGKNVPMYRTNLSCQPAGKFRGDNVVSMRPIPLTSLQEAIRITAQYPFAHGEPLHIGDPAAIGIEDLQSPDFGDAVTVRDGEIPVFWACGVTSQSVLLESSIEFAITHSPGCMFVSGRKSNGFTWG